MRTFRRMPCAPKSLVHALFCEEESVETSELQHQLEFLVGEPCAPPDSDYFEQVALETDSLDTVTFDKLTRLLIAAGEDRVSEGFFKFFSGLGNSYAERVSAWRRHAMRHYGNFRFAFKRHRRDNADVIDAALVWKPIDFSGRSDFGDGLRKIELGDTPLLGYIAGAPALALKATQVAGEGLTDQEASFVERFDNARAMGKHNTYEYVSAAYLDVYVATSMRTTEEFFAVSRFLDAVFVDGAQHDVRKISYFDPTQSYHDDRIVKGIVEGLMLKRAACTLYLAQETDTLGKDSELATTLAQGKPVIAYVPDESEVSLDVLVDDLKRAASGDIAATDEERPEYQRLVSRFQQLLLHQQFKDAWDDLSLEQGIASEGHFEDAVARFSRELVGLYDRRAITLLQSHPLGLQIHLESGVANGILVTRTASECRELTLDILVRDLAFAIQAKERSGSAPQTDLESPIDWDRYLVEQRTGSVHRVVVGDELISNAFWNWYLEA